MARYSLSWTEPALEDLDEIAAFMALDDPAAAQAFIERVLGAVERLRKFPRSGRRVPEFLRTEYREVIVSPCRVFYRQQGSVVLIVHVLRGERRLQKKHLP